MNQFKNCTLFVACTLLASLFACDYSDDADQVGWSVGIVKENKTSNEQYMQSWGLGSLTTPASPNEWTTGGSYLFDFKISFDQQTPNAPYTIARLSNVTLLPAVVATPITASNGLLGRVGERTIESITPITQIDQTLFVETESLAPELEELNYNLFFNIDSIEVSEQDTTYLLYLLSENISETPLLEARNQSVTQALSLAPLTEQIKRSGSVQDSIDCKLYFINEIVKEEEEENVVIYNSSSVSRIFRIPSTISE